MADALVTNTVTIIPDWTTGGGGGSGAPADARYWVGAANGTLSAEHNLGALSTGLVKTTSGTPSTAVAGTDYQAPLTAGVDYQTPLTAGVDYQTPLTAGVNYEVPLTFSGALGRAANTVTVQANGITDAMLRASAALSVIGRASNSSGDPADIAAALDNTVLRRSGTSIAFGTVTGSMMSGFTDTTLITANGSGQLTSSPITLASNTLTHAASSSGGTVSAVVSNTSNSASSQAFIDTQVAGTSAGSSGFRLMGGTINWALRKSASSNYSTYQDVTNSRDYFTIGALGVGIAATPGGSDSFVVGRMSGIGNNTNVTFSTDQAAGSCSVLFRNTSANQTLGFHAHGASVAGNRFGVAKASFAEIVNSTAGEGLMLGTTTNKPIIVGTNDIESFRVSSTDQRVQFASGSMVANGSGAVTAPGSIGPAAIAVLQWLAVYNSAGNLRYIPLYG